jgi:hypothetical protein
MEATCSSETSVVFQRTTRHYIPEDRTLHNLHFITTLLHDPRQSRVRFPPGCVYVHISLYCLCRQKAMGQSCRKSNRLNAITIPTRQYNCRRGSSKKQRTDISSIDTTFNSKAYKKHLTEHKAHPTSVISLLHARSTGPQNECITCFTPQ